MQFLRAYIEPDKDEVFNCVVWSCERIDGASTVGPILAAGGVKGIVRVIQCNRDSMGGFKNLLGHSEYYFVVEILGMIRMDVKDEDWN